MPVVEKQTGIAAIETYGLQMLAKIVESHGAGMSQPVAGSHLQTRQGADAHGKVHGGGPPQRVLPDFFPEFVFDQRQPAERFARCRRHPDAHEILVIGPVTEPAGHLQQRVVLSRIPEEEAHHQIREGDSPRQYVAADHKPCPGLGGLIQPLVTDGVLHDDFHAVACFLEKGGYLVESACGWFLINFLILAIPQYFKLFQALRVTISESSTDAFKPAGNHQPRACMNGHTMAGMNQHAHVPVGMTARETGGNGKQEPIERLFQRAYQFRGKCLDIGAGGGNQSTHLLIIDFANDIQSVRAGLVGIGTGTTEDAFGTEVFLGRVQRNDEIPRIEVVESVPGLGDRRIFRTGADQHVCIGGCRVADIVSCRQGL